MQLSDAFRQALRTLVFDTWNKATQSDCACSTVIADLLIDSVFDQVTQPKPEAWLNTDSIGERYLCFSEPSDGEITELYPPDAAFAIGAEPDEWLAEVLQHLDDCIETEHETCEPEFSKDARRLIATAPMSVDRDLAKALEPFLSAFRENGKREYKVIAREGKDVEALTEHMDKSIIQFPLYLGAFRRLHQAVAGAKKAKPGTGTISLPDIAEVLHYPQDWDVVAFPTLASAISEVTQWFKPTEHRVAERRPPA